VWARAQINAVVLVYKKIEHKPIIFCGAHALWPESLFIQKDM
jgi:hypothetical protein